MGVTFAYLVAGQRTDGSEFPGKALVLRFLDLISSKFSLVAKSFIVISSYLFYPFDEGICLLLYQSKQLSY